MKFVNVAALLGGYDPMFGGGVYMMPILSRSQIEDRLGPPRKIEVSDSGVSMYYPVDSGTGLVAGRVGGDNWIGPAVIVHQVGVFM